MRAPSRQILQILLSATGLVSIAALVYLAGPLIAFGGWRPFENAITRDITVVLLVAAAAGMVGWKLFTRHKKAKELAEGIAAEPVASDDEVLKERMKDALLTLKKAAGGRSNYLYDLPWYVIIGPPGAGKTTVLANSGLRSPLSEGAGPNAIQGIGGTRNCDWWFTEDAVLIDTAGRYTTQDSDAKSDKASWLAFLDLLKRSRPRQPINGVLVAISLEDVMAVPAAELEAHASAVRARLLELHERLKIDFPVYVLFTKADLVAGFVEFFADLDEEARRRVWGATFQTADRKKNMLGSFPAEFDLLVSRLNETTTDRLQAEPAPTTRVALFGFPAQMARLKGPLGTFLNRIFEPTRYHANATLRGFYFTSGTQQGTPIDQLIGALANTFGAEQVQGVRYSGLGKSFFITDLIQRVIIGEADWVSKDRRAVLRGRIVTGVAYGALTIAVLGAGGAWWTSYTRNRDLIRAADAAASDYVAAAGPLATETKIADRDLTKVLPLLHKLTYMPTGYGHRGEPVPASETFGLSQRDRLQASAREAYRIGLERLFRPRLIYRLEEQIEPNRANPSFLYEALQVYLMLGGLRPADRPLVLSWMRRDWRDNLYPGAANAPGRQALEDHLLAMLDLEGAQEPLVTVNGELVADVQRTLSRLSISQRAYEILRSQAATSGLEDWTPARAAGPDYALVFDTPSDGPGAPRVPGFFTYAGFHQAFVSRLGGVAEQLRKDSWVLGQAGAEQAVSAQFDTLPRDLLARYATDYVAAWRDALSKLRLRRLTADKPRYVALTAAVATTSPIRRLLQSIRDETALTRERPGAPKREGAKGEDAAPPLLAQTAAAPGVEIEAAFKPFHLLFEGDPGRRPIDTLMSNLADIAQSILLATNPAQAQQATLQLQNQVASLLSNANRFPPPFAAMMQGFAAELSGDITNSARAQLARALAEQVTSVCEQTTANRYPFARTERDVPLSDFGRLFGHGGVLDQFFRARLAEHVDTSRREWAWRQETALGRALAQSGSTLQHFQRAARIRDAFFASGGTMPSLNLTVVPPPVPAQTASLVGAKPTLTIRMDVNGTPVPSQVGSSPPVVVQWPGAGARSSAIVVSTDDGNQPSTLERSGPWSFFRLVEAGAPVPRGDQLVVSYVVGGRELQYQIGVGTVLNPFTMPALREFRCPSGL